MGEKPVPIKMSQAVRDLAVDKIKKLRGDDPLLCFSCQDNNWELAPCVVKSPIHVRPLHEHSHSYLMVMVVCSTCGNTIFFNAHKLGIADNSGNVEGIDNNG